jgi:hypothetical protein
VYLSLYAFVVQFPDDLLNDASLISERALLLTRGDGGSRDTTTAITNTFLMESNFK